MRRMRLYTLFAMVIVVLGCLTTNLSAQDDNAREQETKKADERKEMKKQASEDESLTKPLGAYQLEFTITELADGKKINTRTYSLVAQQGMLNKLRVGGRLPVVTSTASSSFPSQFQYIDVGVNIDCEVREREGFVLLASTIDVSSLAPQRDEQTHQAVVRQVRSEVRTILSPGRPTVISGMDDPTTKARFEFEVTATKVK